MQLKQSSFVDLSSLKLEINAGEYSVCFTSQGGKAHGSCEPHLGIVKHFKEHGNINCCIRSKTRVPIESIKVVGYLGSNAADGCVDLVNINDMDMTKPFCKRSTHSGYRIASLSEKDDGTKEVDYSGRYLKTNEPFELDIFSISNSATSVIYCIIATIDAPDSIDGELVKVVSVPLCVHAKKSNGPVLSDLMVYQSSTPLSSFLTNGVVTSTFLTVAPEYGVIQNSRRFKHTVDWSGKSVTTVALSGDNRYTEVYTLSKERQNGQRKSKEARSSGMTRNSGSSSSAANRLSSSLSGAAAGSRVDYDAINATWKNEPTGEEQEEPHDLLFSLESHHTEPTAVDDTMEVVQVSRIIRDELQSCLVNITRRLNSVGIKNRDSLRSMLRNSHASHHQSGLFSLQLLLSCINDVTDNESSTSRSSTAGTHHSSTTAAEVAAMDDIDEFMFDELLSLCGDESYALPSLASIVAVKAEHRSVVSSPVAHSASVPAGADAAVVGSPYVFGQTAVLVPSTNSSSRGDMKRQREEEEGEDIEEKTPAPRQHEQHEQPEKKPPQDDLSGYYHAALNDSAQYETADVVAVTSALSHLSADAVVVEENEEQATPQRKLQKSKSNSNVCDYSRKCHV